MPEQQSTPTNYSERLYNEDLAPVKERTWTTYSLFYQQTGQKASLSAESKGLSDA